MYGIHFRKEAAMIYYKIIGLGLCMVLLVACRPDAPIDKLPEDNASTVNCAADGPGCKQFNEDLKR